MNGLDSFLDWTDRLKPEYETKIFLVNNSHDIFEALNWGEIIWLEWANESAIEALKIYENMNHPVKLNKKIVCRLHSYEALSGYVPQLNLALIDRMVFVAPHMIDIVKQNTSDIESRAKCVVIMNGIDLSEHPLQALSGSFRNIAVVAGISHKKNPAMVLQILDKLPVDYIVHWAGAFQEPRYEIYLKHMIKEMNLTGSIKFYGHVSDMDKFWKDKDYILSTSVHEGHPYNIMEGMARGLKPVIHNFYGAKGMFPEKWLFNTFDEAVKIIQEPFLPIEAIQHSYFVARQGWTLEYQVNKIKEMLNNV